MFSFSKFENCFVILGIIVAYLCHSGDSSEEPCWISRFLAELGFPLGITLRLDLTSFDMPLVIYTTVKPFKSGSNKEMKVFVVVLKRCLVFLNPGLEFITVSFYFFFNI